MLGDRAAISCGSLFLGDEFYNMAQHFVIFIKGSIADNSWFLLCILWLLCFDDDVDTVSCSVLF